jgi:cytidine deaminase
VNHKELLKEAKLVLKNSYSPYSHFAVGAAIVTEDGKIFSGVNVENASYSLTICAERVAIFQAISSGHTSFTDLAIVSSTGRPTFPCGACRQVLLEFSPQVKIHLQGSQQVFRLTDLLPNAFDARQTRKSR